MERIGILGAGRMGIPMALALACTGFSVDLADLKERSDAAWEELCRLAHAEWEAAERLLVEEGSAPSTPRNRIALRRGCGPWLGHVDCLLEAVPERLAAKAEAYRQTLPWLRPDCLVASTTSSFAPDELARLVAEPGRFLVAHWLHPPWLMPLVEVAPAAATAPEALDAMLHLLRRAGKVPVVVSGTPGLVVARLQIPIMNAAAEMVADGVALAGEIDRAVRLGLGFRFLVQGLLEFADTGGVDVLYLAGRHLREALADPRFEPGPAVAGMVSRGELGRKSGRGFYDWGPPEMERQREQALRTYLRLLGFLGLAPGAARLPEPAESEKGGPADVASSCGGGRPGRPEGPSGPAPAAPDSAALPEGPVLPGEAEGRRHKSAGLGDGGASPVPPVHDQG